MKPHRDHPLIIRILLPILLALLLGGCKVPLYTQLPEKEANEIMAALLEQGISCDKEPGKEMTWSVLVDRARMGEAIQLLDNLGHPRDRFTNMGDVFKKEGLISSPLEERIRFLYSLSQEISNTISQIDGVLSARVHVVIPENNPLKDTIRPSSASVFIRHHPESDMDSRIPKIKRLVVNSIEGLNYEKVVVVLFPAERYAVSAEPIPTRNILGVRVTPESVGRLWLIMGVFLTCCIAILTAAGWWIFHRKKLPETIQPNQKHA
jgi:type III secretion protein J